MRKEPWLLKNAFWLLFIASMALAAGAHYKGRDGPALFLACIGLVCVVFAIHFFVLEHFTVKRPPLTSYDKAHYHQARQQTLHLVKGGKHESLRHRKNRS